MKIRMKNTGAGPKAQWYAGDIRDLPRMAAMVFVDAGYADIVDDEVIEKAVIPEIEKPEPVKTKKAERAAKNK